MANQQDDILKQINKSGFPFQLRVENEVSRTTHEHGWSVASHEQPWINPESGASGFIDIVLSHNQFVTFRLVIECKRNKADDVRHLRWVFLLPDQKAEPTDLMSCFEVQGDRAGEFGWRDVRVWDNVRVVPESLQSEFCILQSDEQKRQPILESLASEVLASVEGLAQEEINVARSYSPPQHVRLFMFPVIVTNAEICVCRFSPDQIKITDGSLDAENVETSTVPFIRFRKSLATNFPEGNFTDLQKANAAREQTVFVVNAEALPEFLRGWQVNPRGFEFATQRLLRLID